MSWHAVRGHDRVVELLRRSLAQGRFAHALFFVGPDGVGKRAFARMLAQALLCETRCDDDLDPCDVCPGCLQVKGSTHPDVTEVGCPEDKHELPIKVIRDLCDWFALKPARGRRKVAIVDDADDMNEEASNAFLKTLEEPPPGAVLILIGTSPEIQLETVMSRCQVVRFQPLTDDEIAALLLEQGIVTDPLQASRLASFSEGSVGRALGLTDVSLQEFRRGLIDNVAGDQGFQAPELAHRLLAFIKQAGKESVDQRRRASLLIGELARFFRGVLWGTAGLEAPCPDPADRVAAHALATRLEPDDVLLLADRCIQADYQIHRKLYVALVLDSLMHDLAKIVNPRA